METWTVGSTVLRISRRLIRKAEFPAHTVLPEQKFRDPYETAKSLKFYNLSLKAAKVEPSAADIPAIAFFPGIGRGREAILFYGKTEALDFGGVMFQVMVGLALMGAQWVTGAGEAGFQPNVILVTLGQ